MAEASENAAERVLEPMDRISEVLFGLIMVLTYTLTLGVVSADRFEIRTMIVGALGCNLAWGLIDGGVYLMARLNERGRTLMTFRAVREARDVAAARTIIRDALPPLFASALAPEQIESMRQKLLQMTDPPERPRLTRRDWLGAVTICLLCFLSTFPVVIPFLILEEAMWALRASNAIAVAMLIACGVAYSRHTGLRPWTTGLCMVGIGGGLVAIAIALEG
jgi:hypothetical protein